jgi:cell division protein FtsQ
LATSKKRESVFISTAQRDRARAQDAAPGFGKPDRSKRAAKPRSDARALAEARRSEREGRIALKRRAVRFRGAAIAAAVAVVIGACVWVYNSSLFTITEFEVVGTPHMSRERVLELAAVPGSATLLRFPAEEVAARVSADPWVASVAVTRLFPSGMRIRVTERVPVAAVDAGSALMLIDGAGTVITTATAGATETIPVIRKVPDPDLKPGEKTHSGPLLNAVATLVGISRELAAMVVSVDAASVDETTLMTTSRVEIRMGQADDADNALTAKDELARRILAEQKGKVVTIDVRVVDRATWHGLK